MDPELFPCSFLWFLKLDRSSGLDLLKPHGPKTRNGEKLQGSFRFLFYQVGLVHGKPSQMAKKIVIFHG